MNPHAMQSTSPLSLLCSFCRNRSLVAVLVKREVVGRYKGSVLGILWSFLNPLPMLPNGQYAVMVSVADGDLHDNVQHHWMHGALIINVSSSKIRYGLIGIPFERVELGVINE
jgi:ABC-type polysaccharide/polyol phosphate export permease